MGFRFHRSIRLMLGLRLNLSRSRVRASVARRGAWFTLSPRGTRASVGTPETALSYSEQSISARPGPHVSSQAPGIEVAELPTEEIEIPPAPMAQPDANQADVAADGADAAQSDPRLLPIALLIIGFVAAAALLWAALV